MALPDTAQRRRSVGRCPWHTAGGLLLIGSTRVPIPLALPVWQGQSTHYRRFLWGTADIGLRAVTGPHHAARVFHRSWGRWARSAGKPVSTGPILVQGHAAAYLNMLQSNEIVEGASAYRLGASTRTAAQELITTGELC